MVCPLRLYTLFDGWFVHSDYILCSTDGLSTQTIYSVRRMVCPLRLYTLFDGWFVHSDYILCSTDGLSTQAIYSVRRMVCPLRLYTLFDGWFRRILDSHQRKFKEPNIPNLSAIQLQMPGKEFTNRHKPAAPFESIPTPTTKIEGHAPYPGFIPSPTCLVCHTIIGTWAQVHQKQCADNGRNPVSFTELVLFTTSCVFLLSWAVVATMANRV